MAEQNFSLDITRYREKLPCTASATGPKKNLGLAINHKIFEANSSFHVI